MATTAAAHPELKLQVVHDMCVLAHVLSVLIRNIIKIRIIHNTRRFARYYATLGCAAAKAAPPARVCFGATICLVIVAVYARGMLLVDDGRV